MKPPTRRADLIFGSILGACLAVMIGGGIAWAFGWEYGAPVVYSAGAFANLPMFHFAMHWPYREKRKKNRDGPAASGQSESE